MANEVLRACTVSHTRAGLVSVSLRWCKPMTLTVSVHVLHVSAKNTIGARLISNLLSSYSPRCLSTVRGRVNIQKWGQFKFSQPGGAQESWVRMPAGETLTGAPRAGSAPSSLTSGAEPEDLLDEPSASFIHSFRFWLQGLGMLTICTGPEVSHRPWSHQEMRDRLVRRDLRPRS